MTKKKTFFFFDSFFGSTTGSCCVPPPGQRIDFFVHAKLMVTKLFHFRESNQPRPNAAAPLRFEEGGKKNKRLSKRLKKKKKPTKASPQKC